MYVNRVGKLYLYNITVWMRIEKSMLYFFTVYSLYLWHHKKEDRLCKE